MFLRVRYNDNMKAQQKINSPVGPIYLVASEKALLGVYLKRPSVPAAKAGSPESGILSRVAKELGAYFKGGLKKFTVPLEAEGTAFQKRVWAELSNIPYGQTCSYSDIARRIHNGKAVRAVGSANGKNPHCIIVPCHRVIAADGSLGGYSGGLKVKTRLLQLENGR